MRPLHLFCLSILVVGSTLLAAAVRAEPSAGNDTSPSCISLVGTNGVVPAAIGQFTVVCRDLANNPMAGAVVVIDLSSCPELFVCADQMDANATVDCVHKTVSKLTAVDGSVHFTVLGGSNGAGNAVTLLGGGKIFKNGTLIQSPTVSAYDLDGSGGVGANDLSAWLTDFFMANSYGRSDYDCSGNVGANDLSFLLTAFGTSAMSVSCASHCP
jgi:hypothetical protein